MEIASRTIDDVIRRLRINRKKVNLNLILKAYKFADEHHKGQK